MNCHKKIIIYNNIKFYAHPIYDSYAASKKGQIYSEKNRIILKQYVGTRNGKYLYFYAYGKKGEKGRKEKKYFTTNRFVYECFYGEIPEDKEIGHIDNNKHNNCLNNLKLISLEEYIEKLNIVKGIIKSVISFNIEAKKEKKFRSIKEASDEIGISSSMICAVCKKRCKIAKSKRDGMAYIFNYDDT